VVVLPSPQERPRKLGEETTLQLPAEPTLVPPESSVAPVDVEVDWVDWVDWVGWVVWVGGVAGTFHPA